MRLTAIVIFVVLASIYAGSQEIQTIDLTGVAQPLLPFPRDTAIEALSRGPEAKTLRRARASLEWLETTEIHLKQRLSMLVKVENVGKSQIILPIKARLEDVRPADSSARLGYYSLTLPLESGLPSGGALLGWVVLYGSPSRPSTMLTVRPGQWIRVKADIVVGSCYSSDQAVTASSDFWLSKNVFPGRGDSFAPQQDCIQQVAGSSIQANVKACSADH